MPLSQVCMAQGHQLVETDREREPFGGRRITVYQRCERCGYSFGSWHDPDAPLRDARRVAENVPRGWVQ